MKAIVNNIFRLLLGLIVTLAFTACEFKETIVFDENGGGKIATSFFGEQLGDMLESFKEDSIEIGKERFSMQDFIEENKASIDSLSQEKQKEIYDLADTEFLMENKNGDLLISVNLMATRHLLPPEKVQCLIFLPNLKTFYFLYK